jgi:hypothetical protein
MNHLPTFLLDFNDMAELDLVLFAQQDEKVDVNGQPVALCAGLRVQVCEGLRTGDVVGTGTLEAITPDPLGWPQARWWCRIDAEGLSWRRTHSPHARRDEQRRAARHEHAEHLAGRAHHRPVCADGAG